MIIALATLAIFSVIVKTDGSFAALEYSHNAVARPGIMLCMGMSGKLRDKWQVTIRWHCAALPLCMCKYGQQVAKMDR